MPENWSNDRWQTAVRLAREAAGLPVADRRAFVESRSADLGIIREALAVAERLDENGTEVLNRSGTQFGRFVLEELLGRGGMGDVYSALDPQLQRKVAIKILSLTWSGLPGAEGRFTREARTASALNHPNIVTIHEVVRSTSTVAIVMELVEGHHLRGMCGHANPIAQVLSIGTQTASALAAAHAAGIVHRDIKPENVMLRPDGQVKVLDFGLARPGLGNGAHTYQSTQLPVPAGTWRYMSPEHYHNEPVTAKSDVFALALVLFELSTGHHPFAASAPLETLRSIALDNVKAPAAYNLSIPPKLSDTILAALDKDPAQRPSAAEFERLLHSCELAAQATQPVRRTIWKWAVAATLVAVLAVFGWMLRPVKHALKYRQLTWLVPENHTTAAAISPDGRLLAYANADGVFLRAIESGETTLLAGPRDFTFDHLEWMPAGADVIASGFSEEDNRPMIWAISTIGQSARELRFGGRYGVPSPDGTRIAFINADSTAIWTMSTGGEDARPVLTAPPEDTFPMVVWAPDGKYLLFQRRHYTGDPMHGFMMFERYYARSFESLDVATGAVLDRLSKLWVQAAARAGQRMLLLLPDSSVGPDANQLREARVDARTGKFQGPLSAADAPPRDGRTRSVGLSATANGATVALMREQGQAAVFVGEFEPAALRIVHSRRLTLSEKSNYPHAWTADSSNVLFESNRTGTWDIFRQPIDSRVPEVVVGDPARTEVLPQLSPDGKYVLYASLPVKGPALAYTLMRISLAGGPPEPVPGGEKLDEFRCGLLGTSRCVVRAAIDRSFFVYRDMNAVDGVGRELARTAWQESVLGDWDVSPDGSQVALPNHDSRSARIRVVDLNGKGHDREIALPGLADISGVQWTADGKGWFVSITTSVGKRLFYADFGGRTHLLGDINGWVVPARDGRHVAYANVILDTNVWSVERQ